MNASQLNDPIAAPVVAAARAFLDGTGDLRAIEREAARAHSRVEHPPDVVDDLLALAAEATMGAITVAQARLDIAQAIGLQAIVNMVGRPSSFTGVVVHVKARVQRHGLGVQWHERGPGPAHSIEVITGGLAPRMLPLDVRSGAVLHQSQPQVEIHQ